MREALGADYNASKAALQKLLCDYFNQGECLGRQGKTIAPVECGVPRAKGFKVRWMVPGCGKSGGLRLAVLAFCEERRVILAGAWMRIEDPKDAEFAAAFAEATK